MNSKELNPAQVRGLSERGVRRHLSVSVTNRFLRLGFNLDSSEEIVG
jgi:hypothetical protein